MTETIWKVTVPIDDQPHDFEFPGDAQTVAALAHIEMSHGPGGEPTGYRDQPDSLDVWVLVRNAEEPIKTTKRYTVVGTGHPIPKTDDGAYGWAYLRTVRPLGHRVVWHLLEYISADLTQAFDQAEHERWTKMVEDGRVFLEGAQVPVDPAEVITLPGGAEAKRADLNDEGKPVETLTIQMDPNRPGPLAEDKDLDRWNAEQEDLAEQEIDSFERDRLERQRLLDAEDGWERKQ